MNNKLVEDIANAVLYEGYILYPYRASAVKNRQRWNFGVLYPRAFSESQSGADSWSMQTECLARGDSGTTLIVKVRFLHLVERTIVGQSSQAWQEAVEREITLPAVSLAETVLHCARHTHSLPASSQSDRQYLRAQEPMECAIQIDAEQPSGGLFKIRIGVFNVSSFGGEIREQALMRSLASAHTILNLEGGDFVSLLDPPEELRDIAAQCRNIGTWPVLAGEPGQRDTMLSSPIILYDYPQIAPESAGALFDGTEIDEILTLRILTLTDEEKLAMAQVDERARLILDRTESMPPEQLMKMHGILREPR